MQIKKLWAMVAVMLMLFVLIAPVEAVNSGQAAWAAEKVAVGLGDHAYIPSGERWVYQDSEIKATLFKTSGFIGVYHVDLVVRTKPDNTLVGRWYDGNEIYYAPDGDWEIYLYGLALGVPNK